jgi:chromate transport protein ChrA
MKVRHNDSEKTKEIFCDCRRFLAKVTAFGGPAMVAYIKEMAVTRRSWLDEKEFRDGVALCQTIPRATAMQTATYVGLRARGIAGALASFVGSDCLHLF